jgi:hypothetical protein
MEELREQAADLLASLNEEQLMLVLAYARCLREGDVATVVDLEELLEKPA